MMQATAPAFIARAMWLWIVLGVLGLAYMVFCPHVYHTSFSDFFAGLLVGLALVACFVRAPRAPSS
ncbi:MAG TPA: hypothetical protein VMH02_13330 [Verrucomicrobiae bacterium]|nr:hypothetical protein [Verrucomicrobiae bacterium]